LREKRQERETKDEDIISFPQLMGWCVSFRERAGERKAWRWVGERRGGRESYLTPPFPELMGQFVNFMRFPRLLDLIEIHLEEGRERGLAGERPAREKWREKVLSQSPEVYMHATFIRVYMYTLWYTG